ncbi:MAG: TlpA family protein disulfide reductase [Flavobacteriales bacterium TMED84]|nr:MAG: TlpA family protein disulfide reductase [Flavobacteriales bacterium TMED84]
MRVVFSLMFLIAGVTCLAQIKSLPSVNVTTLEGNQFNFKNIDNNNNPIIISFWATWCKPCTKELNNIAEIYEDWQDETNVKLVAVSIDDRRSQSKVAPYVNSSGWEYEIYIDSNSDLKRAMGVTTVPHTFLLDKNKQIIWQHRGYVEGDEYELFDEILKL